MPWFNVDDGFADHQKAIDAGNAALGLWVRAGSHCAKQLTDGFVSDHMVRHLGTVKQAAKLVAVGLWEATEGGYQFHEWGAEHRNPTREKVVQKRREDTARQRDFRSRASAPRARGARADIAETSPENESSQVSDLRHAVTNVGVTRPLSSPSTDKDHGLTMGAASDLDVRESGPAPSGPGSVDAMRLVTLAIGSGLTAGTRTSLAFQVQRLRADATDDELDAALKRWDSRTGIGPALLGAIVDDIRKEARGATSRPPLVTGNAPHPTDVAIAGLLGYDPFHRQQQQPEGLRLIEGGTA